MIKIWYQHHGQRPKQSDIIKSNANKASTLPSSFEVIAVEYQDGESQFALHVEPPSDNISQDAVDAIATAFENNWGGSIEFVETIVQ